MWTSRPGLYSCISSSLLTEIVGDLPAVEAEPRLVDLESRNAHDEYLQVCTGSSASKGVNRKAAYTALTATVCFWIVSFAADVSTVPPLSHDSVGLACVLPDLHRTDWPVKLAEYMEESSVVSGKGAKVLVWPESAVHLASAEENATFYSDLLELAYRRRAFIAPSYTAPSSLHREKTVIATSLFSSTKEVLHTYNKQSLVPIAESYGTTAGTSPLPHAKDVFVPFSGQPGKVHPRGAQFSISAAICHDTSFPGVLRQSYPASLTIVPSSVFSERIAWTRIFQAASVGARLGLSLSRL